MLFSAGAHLKEGLFCLYQLLPQPGGASEAAAKQGAPDSGKKIKYYGNMAALVIK